MPIGEWGKNRDLRSVAAPGRRWSHRDGYSECMDRWSPPPTPLQRWDARHRTPVVLALVALLLVDLVVGVLDLATRSGFATVGAIGGAAGIISGLLSFRGAAKFVDTWDAEHGQPAS